MFCVCCTEPWCHHGACFKVVNGCSAPRHRRILGRFCHMQMEKGFSPAWCLQVICGIMCDKQIGKYFLFLIFQLAKPLVEQHEKCSFRDRSNLAVAAAASLGTIFHTSSRTLQVLLSNWHLFIISSLSINNTSLFSCLAFWSRCHFAHI